MSTLNRKLAYLRDRVVNAWWMLREGRIKDIFGAIFVELRHRIEAVHTYWKAIRPHPLIDVRDSELVNLRNVRPPSYRPTVAIPMEPLPLTVDRAVISSDIAKILGSIELPDGRNEQEQDG